MKLGIANFTTILFLCKYQLPALLDSGKIWTIGHLYHQKNHFKSIKLTFLSSYLTITPKTDKSQVSRSQTMGFIATISLNLRISYCKRTSLLPHNSFPSSSKFFPLWLKKKSLICELRKITILEIRLLKNAIDGLKLQESKSQAKSMHSKKYKKSGGEKSRKAFFFLWNTNPRNTNS